MSDAKPFDAAALHRLIDAALADAEPAPAESGAESGEAPIPSRALPITMLNTELFETVATVTARYLHPADQMQLLSELRAELYRGLAVGTAAQLYRAVTNCRRCPTVDGTPQLPTGNREHPDLLIIHELPFRGAQVEQTLAAELGGVGFDPDRVCHTSLIRCDPATMRKPADAEIQACSRYLSAEIQLLAPKLIVLLGALVLQTICGPDLAITKERGNVFYFGPWMFLPTYGLGYLGRQEKNREEFVADLRLAYTLCYGGVA